MYLLINAGFSILSALVMILFNQQIQTFMGFSNSLVLITVGVGLLIFSDFVIYAAFKLTNKRWAMLTIIGLDEIWVVASVILIIFNPFVLLLQGRGLMLEIAGVIGFLAFMQYRHSNLNIKNESIAV